MRKAALDSLRRFYKQFSNANRVLVPINADPDAIASAMAVKRLLWRHTASVTIANVNEIKRLDNLSLVRRIGLVLVPFKQIAIEDYHRVVMVDSQPDHHEDFDKLAPQVIIDHHPKCENHAAAHIDIRPHYGATASILTEYLRAAKIKPSINLATALYLAIKTDTSNFERKTTIEDLKAFQYVFRYANVALAHRIEQAGMRLDFLKYFKLAIDNRSISKGRICSHLGPVSHPDALVQIADFFIRVEEVSWSIVSGTHKRKLVVILRNDGSRKNAGTVARQSFADLGYAGGHKSAARAELHLAELSAMADHRDLKKMAAWVRERINQEPQKAQ